MEDLRIQPLQCVHTVLRTFGARFEAVAQRTGPPPSILDDADNRIAFADACRLMTACDTVTGCAHFGLLVGRQAGATAVGMIG